MLRGTTSAHAENTTPWSEGVFELGNYLRVRGEYTPGASRCPPQRELPPRARRIQPLLRVRNIPLGTTSACAENTAGGCCEPSACGNYLRVRGEYFWEHGFFPHRAELPPRARRILTMIATGRPSLGTTSACAENTRRDPARGSAAWNYLRVRGEYFNIIDDTEAGKELPPRARRIPQRFVNSFRISGTTSACAENTLP